MWAATLAVAVAIYATLGLAGELAGELRSRNLLDAAFGAAALVLAAAIVTLGLRARPGLVEVAAAAGVAAVYLLVAVRVALPEERTHLVEYGLLAVLIHEALAERGRHGRPVRAPAVLAAAGAAALGAVDEAVQAVLPNRVFDPVDLGFNLLAATMAVAALRGLQWARRRR